MNCQKIYISKKICNALILFNVVMKVIEQVRRYPNDIKKAQHRTTIVNNIVIFTLFAICTYIQKNNRIVSVRPFQ